MDRDLASAEPDRAPAPASRSGARGAAGGAWAAMDAEAWAAMDAEARAEWVERAWTEVGGRMDREAWAEVGDRAWAEADEEARAEVVGRVWAEMGGEMDSGAWAEMDEEARAEVVERIWAEMGGEMDSEAWAEMDEEARAEVVERIWAEMSGRTASDVSGESEAGTSGGSRAEGGGEAAVEGDGIEGGGGAGVEGGDGEDDARVEIFYQYAGEDGGVTIVDDPEQVPASARGRVKVIEFGAGTPQIYRYTDAAGRPVYVNDLARVPADRGATVAAVDLSGISLNSELAEDLADAIDAQYEALLVSDPCRKAREVATWPWWRQIWHRHSTLVYLAFILLFVILSAPWVIRNSSVAVWLKIVGVAAPVLLFVALSYLLTVQVQRAQGYFDELAAPCQHDGAGSARDAVTVARDRMKNIEAIVDNLPEMDNLRYEEFERRR